MEVLAGVAAVLVPAVAVLVDLARPAAQRPAEAASAVRHPPAERAVPTSAAPATQVRVVQPLDSIPPPAPSADVGPEATRDPGAMSGTAEPPERAEPPEAVAPPSTVERDSASVRPASFLVRGHAPASAPAAAPVPVTVRVVPRMPSAPTAGAPRGSGDRGATRPAAPGSVLGVFSDTEPDRGTAAMRRTTSALVLAAVTLVVATGVAGVIYFGLSRLG